MAKREGTKGQTIQWPREKGQKDKKYKSKREGTKEQTIQWPREKGQKDKQNNGQERRDKRTNNTMAKREVTKGQTIQWPREKGQKDKQYNGQERRDVLLSLLSWPLFCLSFCPFSLGHCIVCPFVPSLLAIVLFVIL
jgi:hypothetical protein